MSPRVGGALLYCAYHCRNPRLRRRCAACALRCSFRGADLPRRVITSRPRGCWSRMNRRSIALERVFACIILVWPSGVWRRQGRRGLRDETGIASGVALPFVGSVSGGILGVVGSRGRGCRAPRGSVRGGCSPWGALLPSIGSGSSYARDFGIASGGHACYLFCDCRSALGRRVLLWSVVAGAVFCVQ